jgi:putative hydrolase of the HAD superfamily
VPHPIGERRPRAVLFDLFHTLVSVPTARAIGETPVAELLGIPADEYQRRYYDEDRHGRCLGRVVDPIEAMRLVAHSVDPTIAEARIQAAVESRRRCFERGLLAIAPPLVDALDRLRAADIRLGLVSDAGADDVESWPRSPLAARFDVAVFSFAIGVRKPDPRPYQRALQALDVAPSDAIFVGDGGSDEHRGARALGLRTVLVTRLISRGTPDVVAERRPHADCEFADVAAFVDALGLSRAT